MTLEASIIQPIISEEDIHTIISLDDQNMLRAMRRIELTQKINATIKRNKEITKRNEAIIERNKSLGPNEDEDELEELESFDDSALWDGDESQDYEEEETSDPITRDYFVSAPASEIIDHANDVGLDILSKAIKAERKKRIEAQTSTAVADVLNTK